jgi:hypothetical protein
MNGALRSVLQTRNSGPEAAIEWALQHGEDDDFNDPHPVPDAVEAAAPVVPTFVPPAPAVGQSTWQSPVFDSVRHSRRIEVESNGRKILSGNGPVTAVSDLEAVGGQLARSVKISGNSAAHVGVVPGNFDKFEGGLVPQSSRSMPPGHYGIYSSSGQESRDGRARNVRMPQDAIIRVVADMDGQTMHIWVGTELKFTASWESPSEIPDGALRLAVRFEVGGSAAQGAAEAALLLRSERS